MRACAAALLAFTFASPGHAAHPLATDDTGTQGAGGFELELGAQRVREAATRSTELGAQLTYGVTETLDAIVRPTLLDFRRRGEERSSERGFGDTSLGFKWRALDTDPVSAGIRADVLVPTGDAARELGAGHPIYHAVAIVSAVVNDDWRVHGNLGYLRLPAAPGAHRNVASVSAAAVWSASEVLRWSFELIGNSPSGTDANRWSIAARLGMIASVAKWVDLDLGYQARLNGIGPEAIALAGATFRW